MKIQPNTLEGEFAIEDIHITQPHERHLPSFDFTTLTAVNTCPTWGVVRYLHSKTLKDKRRPLALEMGAACHHAFAALRLFQLGFVDGMPAHMEYHGALTFGPNWPAISEYLSDSSENDRQRVRNGMMAAFHSSGYQDEPWDKRRTIDHAEAALYVYLDRWDWNQRVWVADAKDPTRPVGVELLADFVIQARVGQEYIHAFRIPKSCCEGDSIRIRYVGRMDGLHYSPDGKGLLVHENKTGGRLDDAWAESFQLSHQITGYSVAASLYADEHVFSCDVIGLHVPLPKDIFNAVVTVPCSRDRHHYLNWMRWLLHSMEKVWLYKDTPLQAPMYTHSCNRYFRPCQFIPFCYSSEEEREVDFSAMPVDPWSPLRDYENKVGSAE